MTKSTKTVADLLCEEFNVPREVMDEIVRRALRDQERWPEAKEYIYDQPDQGKAWQFIEQTIIPSPALQEKFQEDFVGAFAEIRTIKRIEGGHWKGLVGLRLPDQEPPTEPHK